MKKKLLILNGSRHLKNGQSFYLLQKISQEHSKDWDIDVLHLKQDNDKEIWKAKLKVADAFLFLTGTYWDSWGSPLQFFLEEATEWEGSDLWLGKSAAIIVSMHSVGGKGVLSRLQGVLTTLGVIIPPMSGIVLSLAVNLSEESLNTHLPDFWRSSDIKILMNNLKTSVEVNTEQLMKYQSWPTNDQDFERPWLE